MSGIARRSALGLIGLGAAAGITAGVAESAPAVRTRAVARAVPRQRPEPAEPIGPGGPQSGTGAGVGDRLVVNRTASENALPGTDGWVPRQGALRVTDRHRQIQGYASRTSVNVGESIAFHVSVPSRERYVVEVIRLGDYGGKGGRRLRRSEELPGFRRPIPVATPTGTLRCDWPVSWVLDVPRSWTSGTYLARFRTRSGWHSYHPFIVRDDQRRAEFCVVLPTTTWQAYNQWPRDLHRGKSLYHGYDKHGRLAVDLRARKVSFDRPYHEQGLPSRFDNDRHAIAFLERSGYDVTYAASHDLHNGTVDPRQYRGLVFLGHDEYWSAEMRRRATKALDEGVSLAYLTANNVYWNVRFEASPDGIPDRTLTCYKNSPDPHAAAGGIGTNQWRLGRFRGPKRPEQELLGVMYNGIVLAPRPLIVRNSDHWFWADTGVRDGDAVPHVVGGEADGLHRAAARPLDGEHTLLSHSRYRSRADRSIRVQNTSLRELSHGGIVFVAATLSWPAALARSGLRDARIQRATRNVLDRMRRPG
ncbi:hypothetical protein GCM10010123_27890 [Pilimelia anulata]|uniref:N,N-dimethylformamidase beta subunit-like C-terminal domain-containing protein n=1 Tax=Pilimelia anulata TaxID=53371 RepID=A0A8J3FDI7_9ACTN|nr:N,N-dimethylformamidase beta subunit family domain-containing protein [Pilimelia anulata]GGJ96311.1 hypothetical protein GCM10010123_27890 [Pilimelia anulata]